MKTFKLSIILILFTACNKEDNALIKKDSYTPISISSDWFDVKHIGSKTYSLIEPQSSQYNVSYLLIGDSKSIMFDTGSGENQTLNGLESPISK